MGTSVRKMYDAELLQLDTMLARMGHAAGGAIESAMTALRTGDTELARSVIARDSEIDSAEHEIEHRCLTLFLRQQPVAGDLRKVSTALKMVTDIERIADQASDIAEITLHLHPDGARTVGVLDDLYAMGDIALHMVKDAIAAYVQVDLSIKVIECNLRASRSFPFVSKVLKINFIELATRVMLGLPVEKPNKNELDLYYVGIKASQFSFNRLQKADPVLGVDMASTGEVGCLGDDVSEAVLTSMLAVGQRVPEKNILLSTGTPKQKVAMLDAAKMLATKGYNLFATGGTHRFLAENGIPSTKVYWPSEKGEPQALKMLHEKQIDMVVNIPRDLSAGELDNGYKIRRAAIDLNIPLITNARLASAFIQAFCTLSVDDICIKSWQEYK